MTKKVYFVTGIDTDAGKSYATGWLARMMAQRGESIITQKFVQTGCDGGVSEDIALHRRIQGIDLLPEDLSGLTCPVMFRYPASADLAARLENTRVDFAKIRHATAELSSRYDTVLIEGAGGIMVPLRGEYTTMDYITNEGLPVILVTNPKLGSVNHTLLSLEVCRSRGVEVAMVVYNALPCTSDIITKDTREVLRRYMDKWLTGSEFLEVPEIIL